MPFKCNNCSYHFRMKGTTTRRRNLNLKCIKVCKSFASKVIEGNTCFAKSFNKSNLNKKKYLSFASKENFLVNDMMVTLQLFLFMCLVRYFLVSSHWQHFLKSGGPYNFCLLSGASQSKAAKQLFVMCPLLRVMCHMSCVKCKKYFSGQSDEATCPYQLLWFITSYLADPGKARGSSTNSFVINWFIT